MAPLQSLGFMLLLAAASSVVGSAAPLSGYRLELTHVDSKGSFSKSELIRRAAHRRRLRAAKLCATHGSTASAKTTSPTWDTRSKVHWSSNEYIVELAIGMPPVPFTAIADTGSDLIWAQSHPCTHCVPQPTPLYNPFASSSFSLEPCSSAMCKGNPQFPLEHNCSTARRPQLCRYHYGYGDGAYSKGVLARETLTFRGSTPGKFVSVAGVVFGCGNDNMGSLFNSTGTFGLGRGPLSAVAQLGFGKFSYCLTDHLETKLSSPLLFGSVADLTASSGAVQSTPLVQLQLPQRASFYYVSLQGISVGETRLPIPEHVFEIQSDGSGGMIVDSGSSFTTLDERAFRVVAGYLEETILGLPASNDTSQTGTCYGFKAPPDMPDMVLHFAGGADMRLPRDSYMLFDQENSALCLGIEGTHGMSFLGNFQQKNMHILYDITEGYLSFVPADCGKL